MSPTSPQSQQGNTDKAFYVTTPIYYVNATPHLGTFYTTVVADAFARFRRSTRGKDSTFLLTGLDEHGQKIERIASEKGLAPQVYCDGIASEFQKTWERAGITYDRFIRTTDSDHKTAVEAMWNRMTARGDIYQADYDALYCVGCEGFKTDDEVVVVGSEKLCPTHRKPVERVKETNYFFRLSAYADRLLALYESPGFFIAPESRKNEVAEFVRSGLRDISVSRMSVKWGIPVPGDPKHTIYVWIDALTNYLTALGGPDAVEKDPRAAALWAQSHHIIAKDILRFHAVYWPAMLMSAGLPVPHGIFCHGFLTVKGQKISKGLPATRVDPNAIADILGMDALRYFVLREYSFGSDGDFSYEALFQRHESDLGNDLGNLLNRTISMAHKFLRGKLPALDRPAPLAGGQSIHLAVASATRYWNEFAPSRALEETWRLIRGTNVYIDQSAPWNLAKLDDTAGVMEVICNSLELVRIAALLVAPVMPEASREILRQLGRSEDTGTWPDEAWHGWRGGTLTEPQPVFPRLDPILRAEHIARLLGETPVGSGDTPPPEVFNSPVQAKSEAELVDFEDFKKIEFRTAHVVACEPVPKTDKLLKLTLDLGTEQRTVVSGIAAAYTPDAMIGKTVILVANLKPAKLRGIVSEGMVLAAGDASVLGLATIDTDVPPGTRVL
jgi:methionyl-tRNA synthetase